MDNEAIFRAITVVLTMFTALTRTYYAIRSARVEGQGMEVTREEMQESGWIAFFAAVAILAILVFITYPDLMAWSRFPAPLPLRWAAAAVGGLGLLLLVWSHLNLDRNFFAGMQIRNDHELVTQGPYHWIRHPMYLAFVLLGLGYTGLTTSWFIGGTWFAGFLMMLGSRFGTEEQTLIERFGDEYREYRKKTGGFIPRPWRRWGKD
jgi:protein-S-isoprenylcysteine O-methyltransferase Ste14